MTDNHRILTYFVPGLSQDEELLAWVKQNGRRNLSDFGREAFTCLRQVQSHAATAGLSWQEWVEQASAAIAAGVKLARGEE